MSSTSRSFGLPSAPDVPSTTTEPSRLAIMHSPTHGRGPDGVDGATGRSTSYASRGRGRPGGLGCRRAELAGIGPIMT